MQLKPFYYMIYKGNLITVLFFGGIIMTHEDEGNYKGKHAGAALDEKIAEKIRERMKDNGITCAGAHNVARDMGVSPQEVGVAIDLMEIKIRQCQLGFFGKKGREELTPEEEEKAPEILEAVESRLVEGRLPCVAAWEIADEKGVQRIAVALACGKKGIKISRCQLGAFV
jgi:hypothetical protein